MPILEQVQHEITQRSMLAQGERVLVAVSGGPDSTALLHLLHRLAPAWRLTLHVFHMEHGLRGAASAADAVFVADLAHRLGLPFTQVTVPAGELKEAPGSLQSNARARRYAELFKLAQELGAQRIATGHNRDDQAETVLMRLFRGSGTTGLAGIPPVRAEAGYSIIRPLLFTSRAEIENYCFQHKLNPRLDASNSEADYLRNRIRLELLPFLEKEYNHALRQNLSQSADLLRAEDQYLEQLADEAFTRCALDLNSMVKEGATVMLSGVYLAKEPLALARRVIRKAIRQVIGSEDPVGYEAIERAYAFALRPDGSHELSLPHGVRLTVAYGLCRFDRVLPGEAKHEAMQTNWAIATPGETSLLALGIKVRVEERSITELPADQPPEEIWLDPTLLAAPLSVRYRLPGDRLWPQGMSGSKKLQDILVDAKVPRWERERLPLLVSGSQLLWIPGIRRDRRFLATAAGSRAWRVVWERLAQSGADAF